MRWSPPLPNIPHVLRNGMPLIQELYFDDQHARWKMLVTCLSLNLTTGKQARSVLPALFKTYDTPKKLAESNEDRLYHILKPLGMVNKRVKTYRRFSNEFLSPGWPSVKKLYGCGQYAQDSDDIFYSGHWAQFISGRELKDSELKRYVNFIHSYYNLTSSGS